MHLAHELLVKVQCRGGSRSFAKEKKTIEDKYSGWPLEVDNDQLRGSSKLILLQLNEKFLKHSTLTILWLFNI